MFKSTDKKIYISICCLLVILLVVGCMFWMNNINNKPDKHNTSNNNKEQFTDVTTLTSDELLERLKSTPEGLQEVVALENLSQTITEIFNSKISENISTINDKIEELSTRDVMNTLPKGTVIMWDNSELPNDKWKWCNGEGGRPDLSYRFPLGGKNYGSDKDKPKGDNNGLIKENNVPKHTHPLNSGIDDTDFPSLKHNHTMEKAGEHTHNIPVNYSSGGDGSAAESDNNLPNKNRYVTKKLVTEKDGFHRHDIGYSLGDIDDKIKNHIIGEGPDYKEDQYPFFPLYTLVNFIIKVE